MERAPIRYQLFGALALLVGGFTLSTTVVSSVGMALGDEAYTGGDLIAALSFGFFSVVICLLGWRAHRRGRDAHTSAAPLLARVAIPLVLVGLRPPPRVRHDRTRRPGRRGPVRPAVAGGWPRPVRAC